MISESIDSLLVIKFLPREIALEYFFSPKASKNSQRCLSLSQPENRLTSSISIALLSPIIKQIKSLCSKSLETKDKIKCVVDYLYSEKILDESNTINLIKNLDFSDLDIDKSIITNLIVI